MVLTIYDYVLCCQIKNFRLTNYYFLSGSWGLCLDVLRVLIFPKLKILPRIRQLPVFFLQFMKNCLVFSHNLPFVLCEFGQLSPVIFTLFLYK